MKFSIILPTYNRAEMIQNAINSVLKQKYKDWELIIVDDGSTDKTKDVIDKFIEKDNRVKYLYQKNQERSAARNNGIKEAKGDWICFLDSDDIYHVNHLEEFKNLIKQKDSKRGLYFSGLSFGLYSEDFEDYDLSHQNNIEFIFLNTIGTPRACVHKSIILKNLFNEKIKIGEDRELWSRILNNHPLYWHNKKTFIEIEHPNRSVNKISSRHKSLKTLRFIINSNKNKIRNEVKRQCFSNSYFSLAKGYIYEKRLTIALYYIFRSIFTNFQNPQTRHKTLLVLSILCLYNKKAKSPYERLN